MMVSPYGVTCIWLLFLVCLVAAETNLVDLNAADCPVVSSRKEVLSGWIACRVPADPASGCGGGDIFQVKTLPTTALLVLLENDQIVFDAHHAVTAEDLYFGQNLGLLPDIDTVGRDFFTLMYQLDVIESICHQHQKARRQTLRIEGINYRATAYLNGRELPEIGEGSGQDGMFRRRHYNVTEGGRFNIVVEPPLHPGTASGGGGQGGNHDLAKDGATAQYMLGWDWCQAMPDRATGFYGSVALTTTSGPVALLDPTVQTVDLEYDDDMCSLVVLRFLVHLECDADECAPGGIITVTSDWGESWTVPHDDTNNPDVISSAVTVEHPDLVRLWWPHGVGRGDPHLHTFTFSVSHLGVPSDETTVQVGIRTIETYLDQELQGQSFKVNGKRIYLVGGNWISTDQALRFSASKERYCNEINLHRQAGINLIRVWAGGTAERDKLYECADELGVLVYQEFWMSGDNNGRWAGNYSWPLDYDAYISNVRDTARRLRSHASLLFYGGCNECLAPRQNPWFPNPPKEINDFMHSSVMKLDPGRFYIPSSMGGSNKADTFQDPTLWANRSYSLAFADGPYGMLLPPEFFQHNPGLRFKNISIGFQPEIGSVSAPTYQGLLRFMTKEDADAGVPAANGEPGPTWKYHKYADWSSTNGTYDHIYAYLGHPNRTINASEWCAAAQLAAHAQYQNLFNGFISHIFEYTVAVIMWKTQSPWPALRGFLYDWYLETTGTMRGVQAALGSPVSVVLDASTWRLRIVNRHVYSLKSTDGGGPVGAKYTWVSLGGKVLATEKVFLSASEIAPMSARLLGDGPLEWPVACSSVLFLKLQPFGFMLDDENSYVSWHWLTNPAFGNESDYTALGEARSQQLGKASITSESCVVSGSVASFRLAINVPQSATEVLFYPTFAVYTQAGEPILPLFDPLETQVVLLPGETQVRTISSSSKLMKPESIVRVEMTSWNAPTLVSMLRCSSPSTSNS